VTKDKTQASGLSALAALGHRERKKKRTRERLIESAVKLFAERGYEETRIDDIVEQVDVVPRTFFRYFCSKDDALFSWMEEIRDEALQALRIRPKGEGIVTALIAAHAAFIQAIGGNPRIALAIHQTAEKSPEMERRFAAFKRRTQEAFAEELGRRLPSSAAHVAIAMAAAVSAAFGMSADQWAQAHGARSLADFWNGASAKLVKLFEDIDSHYVLR
jgi:AcrR family transcriptional regulator